MKLTRAEIRIATAVTPMPPSWRRVGDVGDSGAPPYIEARAPVSSPATH